MMTRINKMTMSMSPTTADKPINPRRTREHNNNTNRTKNRKRGWNK